MKTIREIRKILFDTDKGLNVGNDKYDNKGGRDFLYSLDNQDRQVKCDENEFTITIFEI